METSSVDFTLINEFNFVSSSNTSIPLPYASFSSVNTFGAFYSVYGSLVIVVAYIPSVYYGLVVYRELQLQKSVMAVNTVRLQRQITNIMLIQVRGYCHYIRFTLFRQ